MPAKSKHENESRWIEEQRNLMPNSLRIIAGSHGYEYALMRWRIVEHRANKDVAGGVESRAREEETPPLYHHQNPELGLAFHVAIAAQREIEGVIASKVAKGVKRLDRL